MRLSRFGLRPGVVVGIVALTVTGSGCSHQAPQSAPGTSATTTSIARTPRAVSTSPAGVTTAVDVPAHSTEEEYFQACHAATVWMQDHPGDPQAQPERYLAAVQQPGVVGPGTWNIAWAALPLARQAGVIVAARAAARSECG